MMSSNETAITAVVADDEEMIAHIIAKSLRDIRVSVVGIATNGRDAVDMVMKHRPRIVLLDVAMPICDGIKAASLILNESSTTRVIILTGFRFGEHVTKALEMGVHGIVFKSDAFDVLQEAIETVHHLNRRYISPAADDAIAEAFAPGTSRYRLEKLAPADRRLLQLIGEGYTSKEIANNLGIPTRTVENHRLRIMKELDLHNTARLVLFAVAHRLVDPHSVLNRCPVRRGNDRNSA